MGKVASTAIADALRREGLSTIQAHIADRQRLQRKLEILTSADVSDTVANRMYEDYLQELRATFLLARRRLSGSPQGPLRVISLTRDPLSWYWSQFAQNYDHYKTLLERYYEYHKSTSARFSAESAFIDVQRTMFEVLRDTRCAIDSADALPALMEEADALDPTNVVFSQLNRFLLPLRWFHEDFLPATGVDVLRHDFDSDRGCGRIEASGLSILLLRYEDLAGLATDIAEFTGLGRLELRPANVSEDKDVPIDLRNMQQLARAQIPPALMDRIYATPYARHFGYRADANPALQDSRGMSGALL